MPLVLAAKPATASTNLAAIAKLVAPATPIKLPVMLDVMRRLITVATTLVAERSSAVGIDVHTRGRGVGIMLATIFDVWLLLLGGTTVDRVRIVKVLTQQIDFDTCP